MNGNCFCFSTCLFTFILSFAEKAIQSVNQPFGQRVIFVTYGLLVSLVSTVFV